MSPETILLMLPVIGSLLSTLCSIISAITPDSKLGKMAPIVNKLALNIGKAKNDPSVNA